jgi:site-specific DNA-methyltransferase (adenine-specific)
VFDTVLGWLYGQGMTKGQRIDKMVDRRLGKSGERPVLGEYDTRGLYDGSDRAPVDYNHLRGDGRPNPTPLSSRVTETAPATEDAARWVAHRTPTLSPGWEPILMARSDRQGTTYAQAALTHGAGMINRELGGVPFGEGEVDPRTFGKGCGGWLTDKAGYGGGWSASGKRRHRPRQGHWGGDNATCKSGFNDSPDGTRYATQQHPNGRYPVNVILDEAAAARLDADTGLLPESGGYPHRRLSTRPSWSGGWKYAGDLPNGGLRYGDGRVPSRFFYVAKANHRERDAGLRPDLCYHCWQMVEGKTCPRCSTKRRSVYPGRNPHVAIKPVQLARILAEILLPPRLDAPRRLLIPFSGSGSEGIGAYLAGGQADCWDEIVLVERDAGYARVSDERLRFWTQFTDYDEAIKAAKQLYKERGAQASAGGANA